MTTTVPTAAEPAPEAIPPRPSLFSALLKEARPRQWPKNGLVFIALIFGINQYWQASEPLPLTRLGAAALVTFVAFCLFSSATYYLNDLMDVEKDRLHPKKRFRPIAAGYISRPLAIAMFVGLTAAGLALCAIISLPLALLGAFYMALMTAYSTRLKHIVIIDISTVAAGFVIRIVAGAIAIGIPVSPWLYVCTTLGALFISVAKRRNEVSMLGEEAGSHRPILADYPFPFTDQLISILASATVVAYSLYTFTAPGLPANDTMMLTIPFVVYGIFRYLYLIYVRNEGGAPEDILIHDRPILATVVLWLGTAAAVLLAARYL